MMHRLWRCWQYKCQILIESLPSGWRDYIQSTFLHLIFIIEWPLDKRCASPIHLKSCLHDNRRTCGICWHTIVELCRARSARYQCALPTHSHIWANVSRSDWISPLPQTSSLPRHNERCCSGRENEQRCACLLFWDPSAPGYTTCWKQLCALAFQCTRSCFT